MTFEAGGGGARRVYLKNRGTLTVDWWESCIKTINKNLKFFISYHILDNFF